MVIISLKQGRGGQWNVARAHVTLFSDMPLEAAIVLAKEVAHDEHMRSGRSLRVEMPGVASTLVLARYLEASEICGSHTMAA